MTYKLHRLARGSYDLVLDGEIVGSVVRNMTTAGNFKGWRAELLDDDPGAAKPEPFTAGAHEFEALSDVTDWLGSAEVVDEPSDG